MRTSLVVCFCVFALQNFQSLVCAPVRGAGRYNAAPSDWWRHRESRGDVGADLGSQSSGSSSQLLRVVSG
ncbi:hypothetical protein XENOCAPTIV_011361 [Xenoophorus captivus]|uniref:Secreted protein n=1 Tax=Xenoophorus captivus TaxID=1517983 RepID=A0ABV0QR78_9TELE